MMDPKDMAARAVDLSGELPADGMIDLTKPMTDELFRKAIVSLLGSIAEAQTKQAEALQVLGMMTRDRIGLDIKKFRQLEQLNEKFLSLGLIEVEGPQIDIHHGDDLDPED